MGRPDILVRFFLVEKPPPSFAPPRGGLLCYRARRLAVASGSRRQEIFRAAPESSETAQAVYDHLTEQNRLSEAEPDLAVTGETLQSFRRLADEIAAGNSRLEVDESQLKVLAMHHIYGQPLNRTLASEADALDCCFADGLAPADREKHVLKESMGVLMNMSIALPRGSSVIACIALADPAVPPPPLMAAPEGSWQPFNSQVKLANASAGSALQG